MKAKKEIASKTVRAYPSTAKELSKLSRKYGLTIPQILAVLVVAHKAAEKTKVEPYREWKCEKCGAYGSAGTVPYSCCEKI